ncbi:hypothetical protein HYPSUDRAFT_220827 [Hypholoma sublateritium FD-334 SS-4]|uniref:Uncharacterized protein n=1 Tax=Hypholoma sublateritium (strain FD-334 SS-4) TaxID=945553 RepID=A0A0D2LS15_HYPSF|nr:hypothetical protein HYPSUDRAFT_220827 [Hypholoma sublateritium FD-334 SS-4]
MLFITPIQQWNSFQSTKELPAGDKHPPARNGTPASASSPPPSRRGPAKETISAPANGHHRAMRITPTGRGCGAAAQALPRAQQGGRAMPPQRGAARRIRAEIPSTQPSRSPDPCALLGRRSAMRGVRYSRAPAGLTPRRARHMPHADTGCAAGRHARLRRRCVERAPQRGTHARTRSAHVVRLRTPRTGVRAGLSVHIHRRALPIYSPPRPASAAQASQSGMWAHQCPARVYSMYYVTAHRARKRRAHCYERGWACRRTAPAPPKWRLARTRWSGLMRISVIIIYHDARKNRQKARLVPSNRTRGELPPRQAKRVGGMRAAFAAPTGAPRSTRARRREGPAPEGEKARSVRGASWLPPYRAERSAAPHTHCVSEQAPVRGQAPTAICTRWPAE